MSLQKKGTARRHGGVCLSVYFLSSSPNLLIYVGKERGAD